MYCNSLMNLGMDYPRSLHFRQMRLSAGAWRRMLVLMGMTRTEEMMTVVQMVVQFACWWRKMGMLIR